MASTDKTDFASDPRMTLNEQTGKWSYVGEDDVSYEYDENVGAWFPMVGNETNE
jgi:HIV Tat-specific factor 1